ncbi:urea transporter [Gelidibacter pelagius]|uniref:Urea transporter n=1 Tax=Gelidibacter pelagius TaxID=2819985 RepID=A0ABS3SW38_9FLAO|nr:urea transporter [Gelidibacter pelagius]MBO3099965.1 urea transporter [Gelidibacter pelagius]
MQKILKKAPFIDEVLKGISQILLQENPWTGFLFLLGMLIGHWSYAASALLATIVGTLFARIIKLDPLLIKKGVYGYNPALVGITLTFLFDKTFIVWGLVVGVGGILTVLIHHYFILKKITVFTFPYILVAWVSYLLIDQFKLLEPSTIQRMSIDASTIKYGDYFAAIGGFGEVIFQENIVASFIIFLGVYISKPIAALYGLIASLLATLLSQVFGQSAELVYVGLFGFNAVLTAIVFSGTEKENGLWVLIGATITICINIFLVDFNLLKHVGGTFTFPFVAGTWITLWLKSKVSLFTLKTNYF